MDAKSRKVKVLYQVILVTVIAILVVSGPYTRPLFNTEAPFRIKFSIITVFAAGLIISNVLAFIALPYLFKKDRIFWYFFLFLFGIFTLYLIHKVSAPATIDIDIIGRPPNSDMLPNEVKPPFPIPLVLIIFTIPSFFTLFWQWSTSKQLKEQAINEQLRAELNFLKNQLSPHFLFNSLNTIYALTQSDPEKSGEVTLKLSKLLRYLVYDAQFQKTIPLLKEVHFLENYIALTKLRYTENTIIEFKHNIEKENFQIPPLLFLIFVENCLKHGVNPSKNTLIKIKITQENDQLIFETQNPVVDINASEGQGGNVGFKNVQRRLELYYQEGQYNFTHGQENGTFRINLRIQEL